MTIGKTFKIRAFSYTEVHKFLVFSGSLEPPLRPTLPGYLCEWCSLYEKCPQTMKVCDIYWPLLSLWESFVYGNFMIRHEMRWTCLGLCIQAL